MAGDVLDLYVGNPPSFPMGACRLPLPLAYQLGGPVCLAATLTGALTVATVLWRQPVDRLRARLIETQVAAEAAGDIARQDAIWAELKASTERRLIAASLV